MSCNAADTSLEDNPRPDFINLTEYATCTGRLRSQYLHLKTTFFSLLYEVSASKLSVELFGIFVSV